MNWSSFFQGAPQGLQQGLNWGQQFNQNQQMNPMLLQQQQQLNDYNKQYYPLYLQMLRQRMAQGGQQFGQNQAALSALTNAGLFGMPGAGGGGAGAGGGVGGGGGGGGGSIPQGLPPTSQPTGGFQPQGPRQYGAPNTAMPQGGAPNFDNILAGPGANRSTMPNINDMLGIGGQSPQQYNPAEMFGMFGPSTPNSLLYQFNSLAPGG